MYRCEYVCCQHYGDVR